MAFSSILTLSALVATCIGSPLSDKRAATGGKDALANWSGPDVLSKASPQSPPAGGARKLQEETGASDGIPVGQIITKCTTPGVVAITFDDGPYLYTQGILDLLRDNNVKATFFVNGKNIGDLNDQANKDTVNRILAEGHHLGSHTWSHKDLATLDRAGIESELKQLEDALIEITGKFPTYLRPPYFSTNELALQVAGELGYHVVNADIDTLDWQNLDNIDVSIGRFRDGLNAGGSISLEHDIHEVTAKTLVPAIILEIASKGLQGVTVGECLGDPEENWYRTR